MGSPWSDLFLAAGKPYDGDFPKPHCGWIDPADIVRCRDVPLDARFHHILLFIVASAIMQGDNVMQHAFVKQQIVHRL